MTLPVVPSLTKSALAARTLREAIQSGQLKPGTRLVLQELVAQLGVSYTPVREATRQLRGVLEPLAISLAAKNATDADICEIAQAAATLTKAIADGDLDGVPTLNAALHRRIVAAAGSELLSEMVERLWNGVPYQAISLRGRLADSAKEHRRIIRALKRRDASAAAEELRAHIARGAEAALATLS